MKQIVILGAGYAGLRTALDLEQLLRSQPETARITLVDQNSYHQVIQILHLTATAGVHTQEAIIAIERLLRNRQIEFVQARVELIDPLARTLLLGDGQTLSYDTLVIALGATTNDAGVPGVREHTFPLRTFDEALALRNQIVQSYKAAAKTSDPKERRTLMTVAIVGGGYTGCQLAGEMAYWIKPLSEDTGAPKTEARIALIDRNPQLLKQLGEWAGREANRVLDRLGVSVYTNMGVARVEPHKLVLSDNRILRAATIVWAGGIRAPQLLADSGLPTDAQGRVRVDRYLRVDGQAHIFALGDCAAVPDGKGGSVIGTASYAMRQGSHLAESIVAELRGKAPSAYEPLHLGELVSLGPNDGVGNPLGLPFTGPVLHLLKKGVEQWYRSTLD